MNNIFVGFIFLSMVACNPNLKTASNDDIQKGIKIQVGRYLKMLEGGEGVPTIDTCQKSDSDCQYYYNKMDDALTKRIERDTVDVGRWYVAKAVVIGEKGDKDTPEDEDPSQTLGNNINKINKQIGIRQRQREGVRGLARWHANGRQYVQAEPESSSEDSLNGELVAEDSGAQSSELTNLSPDTSI